MFFARSDWRLNWWLSCTIHWFTSSSSERATPNSCKLRAKCLSRCAALTNKEIWQLIKQLFPKYTKKMTKFGLEVLTGKALSFWLDFLTWIVVYKCKLSLSLALLYLVDLFINKLKTKFNNLFYRIILNTNRIHNSFWRNFPARAKQTPSKFFICR